MDILTLFVVVPVITVLVMVLFTKNLKQARMVTLIGMLVQLLMSINLIVKYMVKSIFSTTIVIPTEIL